MNETVSYSALFEKAQGIAKRMEGMSRDSALSAMQLAAMTGNPYVQNQRVKQISSVPVDYDKDQIAEYLKNPNQSEKPLREAGHAIEISAYPMFKLRKTYQDVLTCRNYVYPEDCEEADEAFLREWRLCERVRDKLDVGAAAHMIAGQVLLEGKVFYQVRLTVDKARNRADAGCLQQIPSDWTKIVGFNSETKYTVAFNLMYFLEPGTDWRQFGDLFAPYMDVFFGYVKDRRNGRGGGKALYMKALSAESDGTERKPEVYIQNGRWFYWVTLPAGSVWTFEVDDATRHVFSPFTGLYTSMEQVNQYEAVQLALVQNPLISVVLGEIPYKEGTQYTETHDPYKLSPTGREYFEALWYQMLAANNTSGVGLYSAPFENMKLEQLAEAPSANEISAKGYKYAMLKAGNGLVPMSEEPRVGSINSAQILEGAFCECVYRTMERLVNYVFSGLSLKHVWKLKMFGNRFTEDRELDRCRQDMSLGIMTSVYRYNAMTGHSTLEDISMSKALNAIDINALRNPLVSSYNQSVESTRRRRDDTPQDANAKRGRPTVEETVTEGKEDYEDSYGE